MTINENNVFNNVYELNIILSNGEVLTISLQNWLIPIDLALKKDIAVPFLQDITYDLIHAGKVYRNETTIEEIIKYLQEKHICLITAPEGRGKTAMSRIVGFQMHEVEEFEVFFSDLKQLKPTVIDIETQLVKFSKIKKKNFLIILENIHSYPELNELLKQIKIIAPNSENLYVLLNARPTTDDLFPDDCKEFTLQLQPSEDDAKKIFRLYEKEVKRDAIEDAQIEEFIKTKIFNKDSGSEASANLRLLSIYLNTWQENPESSLYNIKEENILSEFSSKFNLGTMAREKKNILLYLSCIYQFDIPFYVKEETEDDQKKYDLLKELAANEGFISLRKNEFLPIDSFYLSHSLDAMYLSKAICKYSKCSYEQKTADFVKSYIEFMLSIENPRYFERDFIQLIDVIIQRLGEFRLLWEELTTKEEWFKRIIENLNPRFVISFFNSNERSDDKKLQNLNYYKSHLPFFQHVILEAENPILAHQINRILKKHYEHYSFCNEIFKDIDDTKKYFSCDFHWKGDFNNLLEDISDISTEHRNIIDDWKDSKQMLHYISNESPYYFISEEQQIKVALSKESMLSQSYGSLLNQIATKGVYFNKLSWLWLNRFLVFIKIRYDKPEYKTICEKGINVIVDEILQNHTDSFQYAPPKHLSHFCWYIFYVDKSLFDKVIKNEYLVKEIEKRIENFSFIHDDLYLHDYLYLLSNFTFEERFIPKIKALIENANEIQKTSMIEWYNEITHDQEKKLALYIELALYIKLYLKL